MGEREDYCIHGRPECECLDNQEIQGKAGWQVAMLMPEDSSVVITNTNSTNGSFTSGNVTVSGGTSLTPGGTYITPGFQMTGIDPPEWPVDPCAEGHIIDEKVRYVWQDDEIIGKCIECGIEVLLPTVIGGLSFEKAGAAVGRAMTIHDGDGEKIGELLADLSKLERDVQAELTRYRRALEMIAIARDLCEQRALA